MVQPVSELDQTVPRSLGVRNAVANAALEGITLDGDDVETLNQIADGVLDIEDAIDQVLARHGLTRQP